MWFREWRLSDMRLFLTGGAAVLETSSGCNPNAMWLAPFSCSLVYKAVWGVNRLKMNNIKFTTQLQVQQLLPIEKIKNIENVAWKYFACGYARRIKDRQPFPQLWPGLLSNKQDHNQCMWPDHLILFPLAAYSLCEAVLTHICSLCSIWTSQHA